MMKGKIISVLLFCAVPLMMTGQQVNIQSVKEKIPTYEIGNPEVDPIFFTGRVYQGAEGYIYPYSLYDVLTEKVVDKEYNVLKLNNQYVDISILPEIGGRIFSAFDKTNKYPFFYTQTGIKPALIGMLGAWLSGGVEWNVPDHHRASTYMPVNWKMQENRDGSKTIWVGETELRHRLKWSVGVSVYPNRSWVEAKIRVINPTSMIQSMLYWANVSVHCNEKYQVIFPPDVQFGVDHHKVYFTNWPEGPIVPGGKKTDDLSFWKNFTESSRSIFAWGSEMEFLAGYDFGKDAGTVHVANRHVVPGKKFFLWGNNPNGHMWNKILSDNDGHYLELMVGAYSDNQPDYSWINPGEIREFSQIWYPIKGIKGVKNATEDAAVNFEPSGNGKYRVGYCATTLFSNARIVVKNKDRVLMDKIINIDPDNFFLEEVNIPASAKTTDLYTALYDAKGNVLVDYRPVQLEEKPLPKVIDGTFPVKEYKTNEELYLAGLRVDQFNNARLSYMDFYNEALLRDSMDARVNIEVGKHFIRQGEWDKALHHLLNAQARLSHDYTSVKNTEALYYLGYVYRMTGNMQKAEDSYWAATWTPEFKHASFYQLAVMATAKKDYAKAEEMINQSLYVGSRDLQALTLKSYILRKQGRNEEAAKINSYIQQIDPLDYWSALENSMIEEGSFLPYLKSSRSFRSGGLTGVQELLEVANNYMNIGDFDEALTLIDNAITIGEPFVSYPVAYYYRAYNLLKKDESESAKTAVSTAAGLSSLHNYPLRVEELKMFDDLLTLSPEDAMLHYYRGNLLYYLGQKEAGLNAWKQSASLNPHFAISSRNIGFAEGVKGNVKEAVSYYEKAIKANPDDPLLMTESDKLCEQAGMSIAERLKRMEANIKTVMRHDDAVMRLLTLYNASGKYDRANEILANRHFHLWEGGGQVHGIYVNTHMLKGLQLLNKKRYSAAIKEFDLANQYPANLEVAPPADGGYYEAKIYYLTGVAYEGLKQLSKARECFEKSASRPSHGGLGDLNYYKVLSLRKTGKTSEADEIIAKMQKTKKDMEQNLMDSYAKFGEADKNVQQSNLKYFSGLLNLLKNNMEEAQTDFSESLTLYPGNIWAKYMKERK